MKKTSITLFLLLSFIFSQGKSYEILETNIVSNILKEGIVEIEETRVFSFKGNYSFVYRDIRKKGYDQLYDIQVFEGEKPYLNTEKEEAGNFRIESRDAYYRIYWYHSSVNEEKTFTLKYKLKNPFTIGKTDAQFRWVYLDDKFDKRPGRLSLIQKFDGDIDTNTLYYSIEQPIRSKKYESIIEENGIFTLHSDSFSGNNVLQLRTIFPASYLSNSSINNEEFSLAGLLLEERNQRKVDMIFMEEKSHEIKQGLMLASFKKEKEDSKKSSQPVIINNSKDGNSCDSKTDDDNNFNIHHVLDILDGIPERTGQIIMMSTNNFDKLE